MKGKDKTVLSGFLVHVSAKATGNQLKKILASSEFIATESQRNFFKFVVLETLAGNSNEIKGFTVATRVFGRGQDFDQAIDPIVSIQANKLRRALERYYLVAGQKDHVHIDIPKGTYIPVITINKPLNPVGDSWPTIIIRPLLNLTGDRAFDWLGAGFASELRMEMTRHHHIKVVRGISLEDGKRATDGMAMFVIDGEILSDTVGIKVIVTLTDVRTNVQIWSHKLNSGNEPSLLIGFRKEIAQIVAAQIGCEHGIIAKKIFNESTDKAPENLQTYEALLRFTEFNQFPTKENFVQAMAALEHAKAIEPRCSRVWSMLARIYGSIYCYELPGFVVEDAKEKAVVYAEKGKLLAPNCQFARMVLAFIRLITDEIAAAGREIQLAHELYPDSIVMSDSIGYVMVLLGNWEQGISLIHKAIETNPYYPDYVHYALWLNWIQQKDYERAYQETMQLRSSHLFWKPLVKASTLGNLGRLEEGKKYVNDLLALEPDFHGRGNMLIGKYIKLAEITERTVNGLKKCGLKLV